MTVKISRRLLDTSQITHLKSEINYCRIYFEDGTYFLSSFTLTKILKLIENSFIRIDKIVAVNPIFVQHYEGNDKSGKVKSLTGETFKVSRRRVAKVRKELITV